jgi:glycosyltransferase involved in cell wall biosynthesis
MRSLGPLPDSIQIFKADVGDSAESIGLDFRYLSAWIVVTDEGVPRRIVSVDLSGGEVLARERIRSLLTEVQRADREWFRPRTSDQELLPSITVVIPTIASRGDQLRACLDALQTANYPKIDIVIVDNRPIVPSDDILPTLVDGRSDVRVVREPLPGVSAARNRGVAESNATIVAFTDDDVQVDSQWLWQIGSRFLEEPELDAVTGLILPTELETPAQILFESYYGGFAGERTFEPVTLRGIKRRSLLSGTVRAIDHSGRQVRQFAIYGAGAYGAGANMAFRRAPLAASSGFDLALGTGTPSRGGEDLAALMTILSKGGSIGYEPSAFVWHQHRREMSELLYQMEGYGIGFTAMLTSLILKNPQHLVLLLQNGPQALRVFAHRAISRISRKRAANGVVSINFHEILAVMARREHLAYLKGPLSYFKSRRSLKGRCQFGRTND